MKSTNLIKTSFKTLAATFGALVVAFLLVSSSSAQCGSFRQPLPSHTSWHPQLGHPRLLQAAFDDDDAAGIVGFWHFKFFSKGSSGIPDGTEVDAGYAQWHSDGTELTNSGAHAPITSNLCTGVWQKTGPRTYKLNHFAIAWDSTGMNLIGPAHIVQNVTLNPNGDTYTGTFTVDQYTEAGNRVAHVQGTVTATRITVATPPTSIF